MSHWRTSGEGRLKGPKPKKMKEPREVGINTTTLINQISKHELQAFVREPVPKKNLCPHRRASSKAEAVRKEIWIML
jgi:hypothetical protein